MNPLHLEKKPYYSKILIIGNSFVGKTCLFHKFIYNKPPIKDKSTVRNFFLSLIFIYNKKWMWDLKRSL